MRAPDWPARLDAVLAEAEAVGWGWGGATCLHLLVASADATAPGADAGGHALRIAGGRMPDRRHALLRVLRRHGGLEAVVARCAAACGFPEIPPRLAASGDWGVAHQAGLRSRPDLAEGVLRMGQEWVYRLPDVGMTRIGASFAPVVRAWAVG
jgi:hypothetical protein